MTSHKLFLLLICGSLHIYITLTQNCENESWCSDRLKSLCTNPSFRSDLTVRCPLVCGECSTTESDPLCLADNGGCEHVCSVSNGAVQCGCPAGFQLDDNEQTCSDVDECSGPNQASCPFTQPTCINRRGNYFCSTQSCSAGPDGPTGLINKYQSDECCRVEQGNPPCGQDSLLGRRIVGGTNAVFGGWPWMVYVLINERILCGGSLIDPLWVLTAGHCFRGVVDPASTRIQTFFGRINPSATLQEEPHVQERTVIQWVLHEDWVEEQFPYHDVALMRLDRPVDINSNIYPICLPNGQATEPGTMCFITGFGTTAFRGSAAKQLQEVDVPIVTDEACAQVYSDSEFPIRPELQICAGHEQGGRDSCQGDSGGPLVCQRCETCSWYQAGVTSFGRGCARAGIFGVYADVEFHEEWISGITGIPVNKNRRCGSGGAITWSGWTLWSDCSTTCSTGQQTRSRTCINGVAGQPGCDGDAEGMKDCNALVPCPRFGRYGEWSECSRSCGTGTRERTRECIDGEVGDAGCRGPTTLEGNCNPQECPVWRDWAAWSDCSETCGNGTRTSARECQFGTVGQDGCRGDVERSEPCNDGVCPGYTQWSAWSGCTRTCNSGRQSATRTCNGGTPRVSPGCMGRDRRSQSCENQDCPVWGDWMKFGPCGMSCGGGSKTRTRDCLNGEPGQEGCTGGESMDIDCNTQDCPVWENWSSWGGCSATCGGGMRTSTRGCMNGVRGDIGCRGNVSREEDCNPQECPFWADFSQWSVCTETCGGGLQDRTRLCVNGDAGDVGCHVGTARQERACREQNCPELTNWSDYDDCTATCGEATQTRTRTCQYTENPADCGEELSETVDCDLEICPGSWADWTEFGDCNVPCGEGVMTRTRDCEGGEVGALGCEGTDTDSRPCGEPCVTRWAEFSEWTACSRTCYGGTRTRSRVCIQGEIGEPGCSPPEDAMETAACNEEECESFSCPEDDARCSFFIRALGQFFVCNLDIECDTICGKCVPPSDWLSWSECPVTCGTGIRTRTRTCSSENCVDLQRQTCTESPCNGFTQWSQWSTCTETCGGGTQTRARECPLGRVCTPDESGEDLSAEQECGVGICPGEWEPWGSYGACSETCGPGTYTRTRGCSGGAVGGPGCVEPAEETTDCNVRVCPGVWSAWERDGSCSETCGDGTVAERRSCIGGLVGNEGCEGATERMSPCNLGECVVEWAGWGAWSECDAECEGGIQTRERSCLHGNSGDVGCEGMDTDEQVCNELACSQDSCDDFMDFPFLLGPTQTCSQFVILCNTVTAVMQACGRTCCEFDLSPCEDNPVQAQNCRIFQSQCGLNIPFLTLNCRRTCNLC